MSDKAPWPSRYRWTSALFLVLVRKTNCTELKLRFFSRNQGFFPKTELKQTDLGDSETVQIITLKINN